MDKDIREEKDIDIDEYVDFLIQLRKANLCFQKQCQAPIGEVTVLLTIRQMFEQNLSVNVSSLGEKLHLSRPAVSRMMHTLRKKGYIEFHPGEKDHRYIYIELTGTGKELIQKELDRCLSLLRRVSAQMGEEDMERYMYYNRKFYSFLVEEKVKNSTMESQVSVY